MFGKKRKYPFNHEKKPEGKVYAGPPLAVYAGPPRNIHTEEMDMVNDVYNGPPVEMEEMASGVYAGPPLQPAQMLCPSCGKANPPMSRYCAQCGAPFIKDEV